MESHDIYRRDIRQALMTAVFFVAVLIVLFLVNLRTHWLSGLEQFTVNRLLHL